MHLVNELNKGGLWSGTNLVALLEVFAERLYAAGDDNPVNIIDARMGAGWTRKLATELSRGGS